MTRCCYKNCRSDSRRNKTLKFHCFPPRKTEWSRRLQWIERCGNEKLTPQNIDKNSYVCSKHFIGRVTSSSIPKPFIPAAETDLLETAIINEDNTTSVLQDHDYFVRKQDITGDATPQMLQIGDEEEFTIIPSETDVNDPTETMVVDGIVHELHDEHESFGEKENDTEDVACQTHEKDISNIFAYEVLSTNEKKFIYLTGLDLLQFEALYNFLDPSVMGKLQYAYKYSKKNIRFSRNKCQISDKDRLCLTLVRLRRGFTLDEMHYLTNISRSHISVIFYTWIQFMHNQMLSLRENFFQSGRNIEKIPFCFRNFDGNTITIVIDATEIMLQMPSNFQQQGNTFSSYKHSNTIKFLLGICPSGAIMYVSEGYEGSVSDKELFEKCDIRQFLKNGDVLMADQGFLISELCNELNVKLYLPPLLMRRPRLTAEEELITKKIAKSRVHVERAIGRIKCYRILSKKCPILLIPIISKIFSIVTFLVNFEDCLVS